MLKDDISSQFLLGFERALLEDVEFGHNSPLEKSLESVHSEKKERALSLFYESAFNFIRPSQITNLSK